ncbi:MAG: nitronate monooxygenase [Solirubrobacteraceae bacterium]|nr:nitronate monooxygenase [Solirubrobacteraceae bacterium]
MSHAAGPPRRIAWPRTRVTDLLSLRYPIVQGPFGGGPSTAALVSTVSNAGGLGSFGAQSLAPEAIAPLVEEIRALTPHSFAINLWVSTHDVAEAEMTRERFDAAIERLRPAYEACDVEPPPYPERFSPTFEEQAEALIEASPPAFSFVYGIPGEGILQACRDRGIVTIGAAATPAEAVALDEAGVDVIVASGAEAGGHRVAFLDVAERSLVGTIALVPAVVDRVAAPVVAAGGIADARGVVAALALGAEGAQLGTAFLATEESGASPEQKALLLDGTAHRTELTCALTGRLARGIPNELLKLTDGAGAIEPFPYQSYLLRPILQAAHDQGRTDLAKLWSGQAAALLRHRRAADLVEALVAGVDELLGPAATTA